MEIEELVFAVLHSKCVLHNFHVIFLFSVRLRVLECVFFLCIDLSLAIKIKTFAYKNEAAFLFTATVQIVSLFCRLLLRCNLRIFFYYFSSASYSSPFALH